MTGNSYSTRAVSSADDTFWASLAAILAESAIAR
jgi:hypothetical protein